MLHIQLDSTRRFVLGSLVTLLVAGMTGCGSQVAGPDETLNPLEKGGKKRTTTTTIWETEPNDDPSLASDVVGAPDGGARMGYIASSSDNDYFRTHSVLPGRTLMVNLSASSSLDYDVQVLAMDGVTVLASNHQAAGFSETIYLKNTATTSHTYTLRVFSADGSYSTTSPYTLMVGEMN